MKFHTYLVLLLVIIAGACTPPTSQALEESPTSTYLDYAGKADEFTGGVKMIPISTSKGTFNVWTKRVGNNPTMKVLLLHGGPGATHEIYECFDSFFPKAGIEYYYYDQLGSYYSDQPEDGSLWELDRFVEEVEQVRQALGMNADNFFLFGQSWGGLLGMQYALKYQENMKGLIISNMMASIPDYMKYADEVLGPKMDPKVYKEVMALEEAEAYDDPRYLELVTTHYYTEHVLRLPLEDWPEPVNRSFGHLNPNVYVPMQGPSEFGVKGDATLKDWDVKDRLKEITVPTLVIGAQYDTMDPEHMEWISTEVQNGQYHHCPKGSHLAQFDDQKVFFEGLIQFIKQVGEETE
ncbi:MAG: proline iminopeptidase-family hydrolase [Bacteroidota bacterium]